MREQSKSQVRRAKDGRFSSRWFVGRGLDIGCGDDPLDRGAWPNITEVVPYDKELGSGDAQFLADVDEESFDFVHSSHCLEHLVNPKAALVNWLRVVKPGGFIVVTVPEELLYEQGQMPSRFNPDHRNSFTLRSLPVIPGSVVVLHMLWKLPCDVEHVTLLTEHWDHKNLGKDQTLTGAECAIEFVIRKPRRDQPW